MTSNTDNFMKLFSARTTGGFLAGSVLICMCFVAQIGFLDSAYGSRDALSEPPAVKLLSFVVTLQFCCLAILTGVTRIESLGKRALPIFGGCLALFAGLITVRDNPASLWSVMLFAGTFAATAWTLYGLVSFLSLATGWARRGWEAHCIAVAKRCGEREKTNTAHGT
jgi:uncharacterized membrane protein HdeD (DUF308 family)